MIIHFKLSCLIFKKRKVVIGVIGTLVEVDVVVSNPIEVTLCSSTDSDGVRRGSFLAMPYSL